VLVQEGRQDVEPALARHHDVEQDDVRLHGARLEDGLARVARFPDRLEIVLRVEHESQSLPDDGVVVDDQDPHAHWSGTSATRVVPLPSLDSI
jgi:hypothetical protein